MSSKMVDDRVDSCGQVVSADQTYEPLIRRSADENLGEGAGEQATSLVRKSVNKMVACKDRLVAAEASVSLERSESVTATTQRDLAAEDCRKKLMPLRGSITGLFGEDYARALGFKGATPDLPQSVYGLCAEIFARLPKAKAPAITAAGVAIDPVALLQPLVEPTEKLRLALVSSALEQRETDLAQQEKNKALAAYDRAFAVAANLTSTFLEIAGERDLARRVRPSNRRPGNTVEIAGGEGEVDLPADEPAPTVPGEAAPTATDAAVG